MFLALCGHSAPAETSGSAGRIAIEDAPATAAAARTNGPVSIGRTEFARTGESTSPASGRFAPQTYRTSSPEKIREEITRLKASAEKLPSDDQQRRKIEDLISALELRLEAGISVDDLVSEITTKVAELRGLSVEEPVRFRLLSREQLLELLNHHLAKDYPGQTLQNSEFILKVIGAIPERIDLRKTIVALLSEQVAGLYDPETKLLYVMKQFDLTRTLARIILAHEICHALQDQHYKLLSMPLGDLANADRQIAAQSVVEGDATLLMQDFAGETLSAKNLTELLDVFLIDQKALDRAPYYLQRQLIFPYMGGADFLQEIILAKGDEAREEAFRKVPASTEQILHPEKFLSRDRDDPTSIALPDLSSSLGKGWSAVTRNVMGEFQIRTLFEVWREWEVAPRAADGWDGDELMLYRNGDDYLLVWLSVWDTESDARDFFNLFSELMRSKRYAEHFEEEEFLEKADVRRLPLKPDPKAPVHLRFRREDAAVLTAISNSPEALKQVEKLEKKLFKAPIGSGKKQ